MSKGKSVDKENNLEQREKGYEKDQIRETQETE